MLALYRGVSVPLFAQTAHKVVVWYTNAKIQHMLGIQSVLSQTAKMSNSVHIPSSRIASPAKRLLSLDTFQHFGSSALHSMYNVIQSKSALQWFQYVAAGTITGVLGSVVLAPVENVKVKLQVQGTINRHNFSGPLHVIQHKLRHEGLGSFYRGLPGVALREGFYYIAYLPTYEIMRGLMKVCIPDPISTTDGERTRWSLFGLSDLFDDPNSVAHFLRCGISGGVAGMVSWTIATPVECVKNRYMAHGRKRYSNLLNCAVHAYQEGGFRLLFAGLKPSVLRAFPVHCTFWLTFEFVKESLQR